MKVFLKKNILLLLLLTSIFFGLDFIISKSLSSSYFAEGEYQVWNDVLEGRINSEIVIYGSSRAWVHIDPSILQKKLKKSVYNLGIDGSPFLLQNFRHKLLLKNNIKPKYIILSIDVFSLTKGKGLYNREQFLPYMLLNKDFYNATISYNTFKEKEYYFPLIRYFNEKKVLKNVFLNKSDEIKIRDKGFLGVKANWTNDLENARKKIGSIIINFDKETEKQFYDFIIECKKKGIKLILTYTPEYIEGHSFVKNRAEIIQTYKNTAEKYNLPFLDYSNDSICNRKELFYNALHLNKKGATIFSNLLAKELKTIVK